MITTHSNKILTLPILLVLMLTGCAAKVGYIRSQPKLDEFDEKLNSSLNIFLSPNIANEFTLPAGGVHKLTIREFKSTLKSALYSAFIPAFNGVNFVETNIEGLALEIRSVRAFSRIKSCNKEGCITAIGFRYKARLWQNGKMLLTANNEVISDELITNRNMLFGLKSVIQNALEKMICDISENIFTYSIVAEIKRDCFENGTLVSTEQKTGT